MRHPFPIVTAIALDEPANTQEESFDLEYFLTLDDNGCDDGPTLTQDASEGYGWSHTWTD